MKSIFLSIAGFLIKLEFEDTEYLFNKNQIIFTIKKFLSNFIELPNFKLRSNNIKIDYIIRFEESLIVKTLKHISSEEFFINFYKKKSNNVIKTYYHISFLHLQLLLKNVIQKLLNNSDGFFLHASGFYVNDGVLLFLGKSGSGKSTIIKILRDHTFPIADDSVIIKREKNNYFVYQTHFIEKESWVIKKKDKYVLKSIFILHKSKRCFFSKIKDRKEVFKKLLESLLLSNKKNNKIQYKKIVDFIMDFENFYHLYFNNSPNKLIELFRKEKII